jgi:hypothetical protein
MGDINMMKRALLGVARISAASVVSPSFGADQLYYSKARPAIEAPL